MYKMLMRKESMHAGRGWNCNATALLNAATAGNCFYCLLNNSASVAIYTINKSGTIVLLAPPLHFKFADRKCHTNFRNVLKSIVKLIFM